MKLTAETLSGRYVILEPLHPGHMDELRRAADDERIWVYTVTVARGPGFDDWFAQALAAHQGGHAIPFAVRLRSDGRLVGSTRFLNIDARHRRLEIGSTWYHPDAWSTAVNPECKLLLLRHAFEAGANRVELRTDRLNERSQAAIARLGATREAVLRHHMVVQNGRIRDTVCFSIIRPEWPAVKAGLERRLAAFPT